MSASNLAARRQPDELAFNPRSQSPLVIRGIELLASLAPQSASTREPLLLWWFEVDRDVNGPVVDILAVADLVVLVTRATIWVLDPTSGREKWSYRSPSQNFFFALLTHDGQSLIVKRGADTVDVLDVRAGMLKWSYTGGRPVQLVSDQPLIVEEGDGICGLDPETGRCLWRNSSSRLLGYEVGEMGMVVSDNSAFFFDRLEGDCHSVVALNGRTGGIVWDASVSEYALFSAIAVGDGLIVNTSPERVAFLEAMTGQERWAIECDKGIEPFGQVDELLLLQDHGNELHAVGLLDGKMRWKEHLDKGYSVLEAASERHLLVWEHGGGRLMVIDTLNGKLRWQYEDPSIIGASHASVNGDFASLIARHMLYREEQEWEESCSVLVFDLASDGEIWSIAYLEAGLFHTPPARSVGSSWYLVNGERLYAMRLLPSNGAESASSGVHRWRLLDDSLNGADSDSPQLVRLPD